LRSILRIVFLSAQDGLMATFEGIKGQGIFSWRISFITFFSNEESDQNFFKVIFRVT